MICSYVGLLEYQVLQYQGSAPRFGKAVSSRTHTTGVACGLEASGVRYHRRITQRGHEVTAISDLNTYVCDQDALLKIQPASVGRAAGNSTLSLWFAPEWRTPVVRRCDSDRWISTSLIGVLGRAMEDVSRCSSAGT
jgi:hypothetical protein